MTSGEDWLIDSKELTTTSYINIFAGDGSGSLNRELIPADRNVDFGFRQITSEMESMVARFATFGTNKEKKVVCPISGKPYAIMVIMGGPFEDRAVLNGFPGAIALKTGVDTFSAAYLGSKKDANSTLEEVNREFVNESGYDWELVGRNLQFIIRAISWTHEIKRVICHSFGIVPFLCYLAARQDDIIIPELVMIEPYWNIKDVETDQEFLESLGLHLALESRDPRSPFVKFSENLKDRLVENGVEKSFVFFSEIENNYYTGKIKAQKDTLYAGIPSAILRGVGHGLNMKNFRPGSSNLSGQDFELPLIATINRVTSKFEDLDHE